MLLSDLYYYDLFDLPILSAINNVSLNIIFKPIIGWVTKIALQSSRFRKQNTNYRDFARPKALYFS